MQMTPAIRRGGWALSLRPALLSMVLVGGTASGHAAEEPPETPARPEARAEVVVTAPKGELPAALASDVDPADLNALRPATSDTASLLRNVPGLTLSGAGGVSSLPALHGLADDRVAVRVDGMELSSACPNHMNPALSMLDPAAVAAASVVAGLTPVSLGGDSLGGTIAVSSAAPRFAASGAAPLVEGQASGFYRSNGNALGASLSATVATDVLSVSYVGAYVGSGNVEAARAFKAAGPAATGQGWLDGNVIGSSRYQAQNHGLALAYRRDGHLLELRLGLQHLPFQGFPNQRMDMTGNDSFRGALHYSGTYSWGLLDARIYGERTRHEMNFADDKQFWYGPALDVPGMPMETKGSNAGATLRADVNVSRTDTLRFGLELHRFRLDDWWPPSGGGMAPNTFWNVNDGKRDRYGLYAEWESRWSSRWSTLVGLRSDTVVMSTGPVQGYNETMAQYKAESQAFNAADRSRTDPNWDATALARFAASDSVSLVAGYSRKSRAPNLHERYAWSTGGMAMVMNSLVGDANGYVGSLALRPEVAHTVSLSGEWHGPDRQLWSLRVTPYYTALHDFVDVVRCASRNTSCGATNQTAATGFVYLQYANQSARVYGIDLSGNVRLASTTALGSLDLSGVLGWLRGENTTTGGNLYNVMPASARLALTERAGRWSVTLESELVAAKTKVAAVRNEVTTAGYALAHLRASYDWRAFRLDAGVENLFNTFYTPPLGGAYVGQGMTMSGTGVPWGVPVPGPGRTFYAGVTAKI